MAEVFKTVEKKFDTVMNPRPVITTPIIPIEVTGFPPPPRPPVPGPTADELHLQTQSERAKTVQDLSEDIHKGADDLKGEGKEPLTRAKGLWNVVRGFARRSYVEVKSSASRTVRDVSTNRDIQKFVEEFRSLAEAGAVFVSSHYCDVVHDGTIRPGEIHICSTHLCFSGKGLRDSVPLKKICSVLPSVSLQTANGLPMIVPLPADRVKPTALQVFIVPSPPKEEGADPKHTCFQFLNFGGSALHAVADVSVPMSNLQKCYIALDRAWRAETKVPVDGVRYAAAEDAP